MKYETNKPNFRTNLTKSILRKIALERGVKDYNEIKMRRNLTKLGEPKRVRYKGELHTNAIAYYWYNNKYEFITKGEYIAEVREWHINIILGKEDKNELIKRKRLKVSEFLKVRPEFKKYVPRYEFESKDTRSLLEKYKENKDVDKIFSRVRRRSTHNYKWMSIYIDTIIRYKNGHEEVQYDAAVLINIDKSISCNKKQIDEYLELA